MKIKKSGQIVMETNVKILIVVIVVALVLSGIFLFGDRFSAVYDNFIPKADVPEDIDEIIPIEERVSYNYDNFKQSGEVKSKTINLGQLNNILFDNIILKVNRTGKTIVKSNFNSYEDANPITEKITLIFPDSGVNLLFWTRDPDVFVEFSYNAMVKKVIGNYYFYDEPSSKKSSLFNLQCDNGKVVFSENKIYSYLNSNERGSLERIICSSEGIMPFLENILVSVKDPFWTYNCRLKIGENLFKEVPGQNKNEKIATLLRILSSGRPNYISSWGEEGVFSEDKLSTKYSCLDKENENFLECRREIVQSSYPPKLNFTVPNSFSYQVLEGDEIFYIKDKEIWRLVYPRNNQIEIVNHCYSSLIEGGKCK